MKRHWISLFFAWLIALTSTAGALFLGEVMGMTPCVLCWYQRIAMFPLAIILGIAAYTGDRQGAIYSLPFAISGVAAAMYHTALTGNLIPKEWIPCDKNVSCSNQNLDILGGIQIPWLSLAAFIAISIALFVYLKKTKS